MADHSGSDEAFAAAWEDREMREIQREIQHELGPMFRVFSPSYWPGREMPAARAEQQRVGVLLGNDRACQAQERLRVEAEIQVRNGEFANIKDSLSAPTPEQFRQAERAGGRFRPFRPRLPDGTVREVIAYRRQDVPQAYKMLMAGVIDGEGFGACKWYRDVHESSGTTGAIPSIDYEREIYTPFHGKVMFTECQMEAQDAFRHVRKMIEPKFLALLDKVVLEDVPIHRAVRAARAFHRAAKTAFARSVDQLVMARELARS